MDEGDYDDWRGRDDNNHDSIGKCPECNNTFNLDVVDFVLVEGDKFNDLFCPDCAHHLTNWRPKNE